MRIPGAHMGEIPAVDFVGGIIKPDIDPQEVERWSRVVGALGEQTWRRLTSLKFCLIGVGRTGSLVATSLAKIGVRWLCLIDPDRLELHNLDAMDGVEEKDIGRYKAEVMEESLRRNFPYISATPLPQSLLTPKAIRLVKSADFLICCVDDDAARLIAGSLACLYAKPLLDIGTGIFQGRDRNIEMGSDIRLILPGDGCILCWGGVANPQEAIATLTRGSRERRNWREERIGSLRSLNQVAAHLGLGMVESLIAGRLNRSTWLRLEVNEQGLPLVRSIAHRDSLRRCPMCNIGGLGDLLTFIHSSAPTGL
jgi:molybdopterin/thiamine biosynthesis adenylyltransferase